MFRELDQCVAGGDFAQVVIENQDGVIWYSVEIFDQQDNARDNPAYVFKSTNRTEACEIGGWWDNNLDVLAWAHSRNPITGKRK